MKQWCFGEPTGNCQADSTALCGLCDGHYCDRCIGPHYDAHDGKKSREKANRRLTRRFVAARPVGTVVLDTLVEKFCEVELEIRKATAMMRSASCDDYRPDADAVNPDGIVGPCWTRELFVNGPDEPAQCDGCKKGQAAYHQRKRLRAQRSGLKRRLVNRYAKMRGAER